MMIFHAEKRAEFPSHKNHDIRLSNAKNDVELEYFNEGIFPAQRPGKESVTGVYFISASPAGR